MNFFGRESSNRWAGVALLGVGHGLGDFNAGVILALLGSRSGADMVIIYLLYNVLAFVGQPFAGLICDRFGRAVTWFQFGGILSVMSLVIAWVNPVMAVVCSGVASAFYHSAGGAAAWALGDKKVLATGLFTAPGVVGLALGLAFGGQMGVHGTVVSGVSLLCGLFLLFILTRGMEKSGESPGVSREFGFRVIGGIMGWLVLLMIAARSFAWALGQQEFFPPEYAVRLAVAAAIGKLIAGVLADRIGAVPVIVGSLLVAAVLLALGGSAPLLFFPAVAALQAGTGPMMALVLRSWPNYPSFGSGLAQGLAVAVGGTPILVLTSLGSRSLSVAVGSLVVAAGIMLIVASRGKSAARL